MKLYPVGSGGDTLVISPYPFMGNDANTGTRYEREAEITGFDFIGLTRTGSDTLRFSPTLRHKFGSAELFDEFCANEAEELRHVTDGYETVIVRGQSTGSFPALSMVKSGILPVTHLLQENGINTRVKRNGKPRGPIQGRIDWIIANGEEKRGMPVPPFEGWVAPPPLELSRGEQAIAAGKFLVETLHHSQLWRSSYSRDTVLEIAGTRPELPMLVKFMGHSGTSTFAGIEEYRQKLTDADKERQQSSTETARIVTEYDPDAWHGYLVYPPYGAANLQQVVSMESLVQI